LIPFTEIERRYPAGHLHTHSSVTVGGVRQQTGNISSDDG
jgi:hypothetical protein